MLTDITYRLFIIKNINTCCATENVCDFGENNTFRVYHVPSKCNLEERRRFHVLATSILHFYKIEKNNVRR